MIGRDLWKLILRLRRDLMLEDCKLMWKLKHRILYEDVLGEIKCKVEEFDSRWNNDPIVQYERRMRHKIMMVEEKDDIDWILAYGNLEWVVEEK